MAARAEAAARAHRAAGDHPRSAAAPLSRERIVQAALDEVQAHGLAAFSVMKAT